jgi:hypothetical protein
LISKGWAGSPHDLWITLLKSLRDGPEGLENQGLQHIAQKNSKKMKSYKSTTCEQSRCVAGFDRTGAMHKRFCA